MLATQQISNTNYVVPNYDNPGLGVYTVDANTILLIRSDTTNNSVVFTDLASSPHTMTTVGDVKHSTAVTKSSLGTSSSVFFDGASDWLRTPGGSSSGFDFGNQPFTFEAWIYSTQTQMLHAGIMGQNNTANTSNNILQHTNSTNRLRWQTSSGVDIADTGDYSNNTWHHVAAVRDGNTADIYLDGVSQVSGTFTGPPDVSGSGIEFKIGNRNYDGNTDFVFTGYMAEIRVSDVARWTSDFTVYT